MMATQADIAYLEGLYSGRKPYHGEMHDHSNSGGKTDFAGKRLVISAGGNLKQKWN